MTLSEEERAAAYRRQMAGRESFIRRSERRLAGSPSARLSLIKKWWPWTLPQPTVAEPGDSDLTNAG
jgi:hypothetical protein